MLCNYGLLLGRSVISKGSIVDMSVRNRRARNLSVSLIFGLGLGLAACSDSGKISEKDYGHKWPFTVASGTLECVDPGTLLFHADGKTYGLYNVMAADGGNYLPINDIRRDNPAVPLMKMSLAPIIEVGLGLCKEP